MIDVLVIAIRHNSMTSRYGVMGIPKITLDEYERRELAKVVSTSVDSPPASTDCDSWLRSQSQLAHLLPSRIYAAVRDFRRDSGEEGALVIDGLPAHVLSQLPTPSEFDAVRSEVTPESAALVTIGSVLGEPVAYSEEKKGAIVHDIVPAPGYEESQSNAGATKFELHVENAFHDNRPDYVLLLCVRSDHDRVAGLRIASCRAAIRLLDHETISTLFEPRFHTAAPASFATASAPECCAVFSGAMDDPDVRADISVTSGNDPIAVAALSRLWDALESVVHVRYLNPGELAIVDNRVALHGRTNFTPRFDGIDRWLLRLFVVSDFRASRSLRESDGRKIRSIA